MLAGGLGFEPINGVRVVSERVVSLDDELAVIKEGVTGTNGRLPHPTVSPAPPAALSVERPWVPDRGRALARVMAGAALSEPLAAVSQEVSECGPAPDWGFLEWAAGCSDPPPGSGFALIDLRIRASWLRAGSLRHTLVLLGIFVFPPAAGRQAVARHSYAVRQCT